MLFSAFLLIHVGSNFQIFPNISNQRNHTSSSIIFPIILPIFSQILIHFFAPIFLKGRVCGHFLCAACATELASQSTNPRCPVCRQQFQAPPQRPPDPREDPPPVTKVVVSVNNNNNNNNNKNNNNNNNNNKNNKNNKNTFWVSKNMIGSLGEKYVVFFDVNGYSMVTSLICFCTCFQAKSPAFSNIFFWKICRFPFAQNQKDPAGWFEFFDEERFGYLERQLLEKAQGVRSPYQRAINNHKKSKLFPYHFVLDNHHG